MILDEAGAERIATGECDATCRRALRHRVTLPELQPALRERIKVRRLERAAAVPDVAESHVVDENQDDVRLLLTGFQGLETGARCFSNHWKNQRAGADELEEIAALES